MPVTWPGTVSKQHDLLAALQLICRAAIRARFYTGFFRTGRWGTSSDIAHEMNT
jgi:hypothetical protein